MGPLTIEELGADWDENRALATGTLPGIYSDADQRARKKTLRSYASTYVREEIQAEALTRSIESFARFLRAAAAGSGQFIDQTRLAKEAAVSRATVQRYYEILEDTLLAHRIDAFAKSERRRIVQHPRFFLFDVGLYNALVGNFRVSVDRIGALLEHLMVSQIVALTQSLDVEARLSSYRTEHGAEVDLILEANSETWPIKIKASRQVASSDTSGLRSFADFFGKPHRSVIAYMGEHPRLIDNVEIYNYRSLLYELTRSLRS